MYILLLIISFIIIIIVFFYNKYSSKFIEEESFQEEFPTEEVLPEIEEPEQIYELNTDEIKYKIFDYWDLGYIDMKNLYRTIVLEKLWINEKFHSTFFKILMIFDKNELMIINSNSKVLTLNIRGKNNEMTTSKSYEVFSSKEIVDSVLRLTLKDVAKFCKKDAQSLTLAICIYVIQKSTHYLLLEKSLEMIENILHEYENFQDVKSMLLMIAAKDKQLMCIEETFERVLKNAKTHPFNDARKAVLRIPLILPQKVLENIQAGVY